LVIHIKKSLYDVNWRNYDIFVIGLYHNMPATPSFSRFCANPHCGTMVEKLVSIAASPTSLYAWQACQVVESYF
jgi:hypothetical protein